MYSWSMREKMDKNIRHINCQGRFYKIKKRKSLQNKTESFLIYNNENKLYNFFCQLMLVKMLMKNIKFQRIVTSKISKYLFYLSITEMRSATKPSVVFAIKKFIFKTLLEKFWQQSIIINVNIRTSKLHEN